MKKKTSIAIIATILSLSYSTQAVTFDLGTSFTGSITEVRGTLTTPLTGTFSTASELLTFFGSASWNLEFYEGSNLSFILDESNSSWPTLISDDDLVVITSSVSSLSFDFSTPNESSSKSIPMFGQNSEIFSFEQSNNVTDRTSITIQGSNVSLVGSAGFPYDDPIHFSAVPEPSRIVFVLVATIVTILSRQKQTGGC